MSDKTGANRPEPPKKWSDERKHLFRKMIGNGKDDLIRVIAKYKNARGDPKLCQLSPDKIKQAINVAKYILARFYKLKPDDAEEIANYYINTGKICF